MQKVSPFKYFVKVSKAYGIGGEWYIEGVASGTLEDRDNERMSVEVLKSFVDAMPLKLTNSHPRPGEVGADLGEVVSATLLDDEYCSLYIKAKLDKENPTSEYLVKKIQGGNKYAFSIEGEMPIKRPVWSENLGTVIEEYVQVIPTAISVTSEPSYIGSFAEAVIKSYNSNMKKRDFSTEQRAKLADTGAAMPDGSFPIKTVGDLMNAISDWGRAGSKADVKAHIISRAKSLGATDKLPADWGLTQKSKVIDNKLIVKKSDMSDIEKQEVETETVETETTQPEETTETVESTEEVTPEVASETTEEVTEETTETEAPTPTEEVVAPIAPTAEEVETQVEKSIKEVARVTKAVEDMPSDAGMGDMIKAQCDLMKSYGSMMKSHDMMMKSHFDNLSGLAKSIQDMVGSAANQDSEDQAETDAGEPTGDTDVMATKSFRDVVETLQSVKKELEDIKNLPQVKKSVIRKPFNTAEEVTEKPSFVGILKNAGVA